MKSRWQVADGRSQETALSSQLSAPRTTVALCLCLLITILFSVSSAADVLKVVVNDTIQPVTAEYIGRGLDAAAANHDQAVLFSISRCCWP